MALIKICCGATLPFGLLAVTGRKKSVPTMIRSYSVQQKLGSMRTLCQSLGDGWKIIVSPMDAKVLPTRCAQPVPQVLGR